MNGAINIGRRVINLIPSLRDEKGLGVWLLSKEKTIPKTSRAAKSKRKSSPPQRTSSSTRESVAERYEQTVLSGSAKDQAMASTVENLSASKDNDGSGLMQRSEARCQQRDHIPMKLDKDHVVVADSGQRQAGDSSREKGGTQEFLAVHSTSEK